MGRFQAFIVPFSVLVGLLMYQRIVTPGHEGMAYVVSSIIILLIWSAGTSAYLERQIKVDNTHER